MGAYYYLCCKTCRISLNLGKKLAKEGGRLVVQGVYSEKERAWLNDKRAWDIIQAFFNSMKGMIYYLLMMTTFRRSSCMTMLKGTTFWRGGT